ncbi:MAG: hypothetical protein WBC01_10705 [Solirubrobacterales bacterium]
MKRLTTIPLAMLGCALMVAAVASAAKPDKTPNAKQVAQSQCKAEKRADKAAFKATYGKRAMRTCVKGEKSSGKAELQNAAQVCRAERAEDEALFNETYGSNKNGKNAFGKCVSSKVKQAVAEGTEEFKNAAKECKAERAADPAAFRETHGSNKNGKNAFGKCVSSKQDEGTPEEDPPAV